MIQKRLRLFTGLVMATFVIFHLINASLGIASISVMEAMGSVLITIWGSIPGMTLLLGSITIHVTLALMSLYHRSHLRLPAWEWIRILLGFSIPALAAGHIVGTRIAMNVLDIEAPSILVTATEPYAIRIPHGVFDRVNRYEFTRPGST